MYWCLSSLGGMEGSWHPGAGAGMYINYIYFHQSLGIYIYIYIQYISVVLSCKCNFIIFLLKKTLFCLIFWDLALKESAFTTKSHCDHS